VRAVFVELPAFECHRAAYLDDAGFAAFQQVLMADPEAGDVIQGTGGLRKVRFADVRRGKGERSGLRVVYFWWSVGMQFWLYTLYDKDELTDLTSGQRSALRDMLKSELEASRSR
jgi:hypothetical protein